ncbi:MAG: hypothetical protein AAFQ29_12910 [Pseudomonadota bacterium]
MAPVQRERARLGKSQPPKKGVNGRRRSWFGHRRYRLSGTHIAELRLIETTINATPGEEQAMTSALINHRFFARLIYASLGVSTLCALALAACVGPAMAQSGTPASRSVSSAPEPTRFYDLDLQVWQDRELLTNPKLQLPPNEPAEITVDDPTVYPDKVKVDLRLVAGEPRGEIKVETTIFLPQNGAWREAAAPTLRVEPGERTNIEVPVGGLGFLHTDGSSVETLIVFVRVDEPASR